MRVHSVEDGRRLRARRCSRGVGLGVAGGGGRRGRRQAGRHATTCRCRPCAVGVRRRFIKGRRGDVFRQWLFIQVSDFHRNVNVKLYKFVLIAWYIHLFGSWALLHIERNKPGTRQFVYMIIRVYKKITRYNEIWTLVTIPNCLVNCVWFSYRFLEMIVNLVIVWQHYTAY